MKKIMIIGAISMIVFPIFLMIIGVAAISPSAPPQVGPDGELILEPADGTFIVPVKKGQYIFNERFGEYTDMEGGHFGIDMAGRIGTIIYSASNGIVMESFDGCDNTPPGMMIFWSRFCSSERGNHLIIKTQVNDKDVYIAYYHLNKGTVMPGAGDEVRQGEVLGQMGTSGKSTGSHLHFEMQSIYNSYPSSKSNRIDPEPYLPLTPFGVYVEEDDDYHYIDPQTEGGVNDAQQGT